MPINVSTLIQSSLVGVSGAIGATGTTGATGSTGATGTSSSRSGVPGLIGPSGAKSSGQFILTAAASWPSLVSGASFPTNRELSSGLNYYYVEFPDDKTTYCNWACLLPSDYDGGTVTAQFYWVPFPLDPTSGENFLWGLTGRALGDNETVNPASAFTTAQTSLDTNTYGDGYLYISSGTPAITLAGTPAANEYVHFRAERQGENALDTAFGTPAQLLQVKINYTKTQ